MAGSFGVSQDEASWILTIYNTGLFLGIPLTVWAAGHFGRLRCILASIAVFAVTSLGYPATCSATPRTLPVVSCLRNRVR